MKTFYNSPIGTCVITGDMGRIKSICFENESTDFAKKVPSYLAKCVEELDAYFHHGLERFTVDLMLEQGTPFQQKVWNELLNIPYGKTTTYLKVAEKTSTARTVRAVGGAVGSNPFAIIVPCHRVIGTNGSLTGFAYGVESKKWLLELEKSKIYGKQNTLF